ncbi:MAG: ABC transporter permease [Candidatus Aminicenantales bacterium]
MRRVFSVILKEFLQLRRDPRMLAILILAPIVQLILLGYAANLDVEQVPLVICDLDHSPTSRDFSSRLSHSVHFSLKAVITELRDVDDYLEQGKALLAVILPWRMEERLARGETVPLQMIVDGAESQVAVVAMNYAAMMTGEYSQSFFRRRLGKLWPGKKIATIQPQFRIWYNPELKSRNFMVPGVLALLLMVLTTMLTSLGIVKEKESGTLEQLIVTPVRPIEIILGKLLPFFLIGTMDILLVLGVVIFWFRVPVKGNSFLLFGLSLIFMLTTLGLGLFISTVSKNQQQAMLSAVFFIIPMLILSGFVFPIASMPRLIQHLTAIVPLRYYLVIIRGLFLRGVGLEALWQEAVILLAFGLIILGLSIQRFRKRIE